MEDEFGESQIDTAIAAVDISTVLLNYGFIHSPHAMRLCPSKNLKVLMRLGVSRSGPYGDAGKAFSNTCNLRGWVL
jgi:hypothetical protein